MNHKGFTMVELMSTIVILGILLSVGVASVLGILNSSYQKTYQTIEKNMEEAAKSYLLEHSEELPQENGTTKILASLLVEQGYLEPIKDPKQTGNTCQATSYITVSRGEDVAFNFDLTYTACLICSKYQSNKCQ